MTLVLSTENSWRWAIAAWNNGERAPLEKLIRRGGVVPAFAAEFIADNYFHAGFKKKPGKKGERFFKLPKTGKELAWESLVKIEYERQLESLRDQDKLNKKAGIARLRGEKQLKELAYEAVAKEFNYKVKPGTVSHIVYPRQGEKNEKYPP